MHIHTASCRKPDRTARSQKMEMYEVDSCVRGHHVFRGIWNPTIGEQLACKGEASNTQGIYTVTITREATIVGHVPQRISLLSRERRTPHIIWTG